MPPTDPAAEPVCFVLYRREHRKGARWRKVATAGTRAELYALMAGAADYHVAPLVDPRLVGAPEVRGAQPDARHGPASAPEVQSP